MTSNLGRGVAVDSDGKRHFYFLPYSYFVRVMAYNKTVFQEAGLDPDKDYPKTWDELAAVAQQIQDPGEDRYGIILGKEGGAGWTSLPFLLLYGFKNCRARGKYGQLGRSFQRCGRGAGG